MKLLSVLCLCVCSSVSWFRVYENLNRICILLLYENWINLNYVELVHSALGVFYILLLFCLFVLLIFESLKLKPQLKILIYLLKKIIATTSATICNFVLYFPSLLQMSYHTFIIQKIKKKKKKTQLAKLEDRGPPNTFAKSTAIDPSKSQIHPFWNSNFHPLRQSQDVQCIWLIILLTHKW